MEWVDGNLGSKLTMKYPNCVLLGEGAKGSTLSIAFAGKGQVQDAGAKMIHKAPNTSSTIVSKSISKMVVKLFIVVSFTSDVKRKVHVLILNVIL